MGKACLDSSGVETHRRMFTGKSALLASSEVQDSDDTPTLEVRSRDLNGVPWTA